MVSHRCDDHRVVAGQDASSLSEWTCRGLLEEVGEHDHEGPLARCGGPEAEEVVGVHGSGFQVEHGVEHAVGVRPAGWDRAVNLLVEGEYADTITDDVGDRGDGSDRVEGGVESRATSYLRRHESTRVDHAEHLSILFDPVLVAHGSSHPRGGLPVHLADVVVGQVLADGLELGPEAEVAAAAMSLVTEPAGPHGVRDAARGEEVGVDEYLFGGSHAVGRDSQAEGAEHADHRRGETVASPPACGERSSQLPIGLLGVEPHVGGSWLADPERPTSPHHDLELGGDPARHAIGEGALDFGWGAHPAHVDRREQGEQCDGSDGDRGADDRRGCRDHRGDEGCAGGGAHRGTGVEATAASTASSGR